MAKDYAKVAVSINGYLADEVLDYSITNGDSGQIVKIVGATARRNALDHIHERAATHEMVQACLLVRDGGAYSFEGRIVASTWKDARIVFEFVGRKPERRPTPKWEIALGDTTADFQNNNLVTHDSWNIYQKLIEQVDALIAEQVSCGGYDIPETRSEVERRLAYWCQCISVGLCHLTGYRTAGDRGSATNEEANLDRGWE